MALTPERLLEIALEKLPYVIGLGVVLYFGKQIIENKATTSDSGAGRVGTVGP